MKHTDIRAAVLDALEQHEHGAMVTQGYEYRRDDDMALWSSADLTYSITYEM